MTDIEIRNTNKILSLSEASKVTGYHQDYLGFLCRTGKLEGQKIGRNWTTTSGAIRKLMNSGVVSDDIDTIRSTSTSIPVRVEKNNAKTQAQTSVLVNTVVGLPISLKAMVQPSVLDALRISKIHSRVLQTTINGLEQKVSQLNVKVDSFALTNNDLATTSNVSEQLPPQNLKSLQGNFIPNFGLHNTDNLDQQYQTANLDVNKLESLYESFRLRRPDNLKVYVVSIVAVLFFLTGTMALAGSGFLNNFFGTPAQIIVTNYNTVPKIAGVTDDKNRKTSSSDSSGTVLNNYVTNYQVPVSLDEAYLNKLIYDNLVSAKGSGLFGSLSPMQPVPNNDSFSPPIGLPTSYAPISYYQPSQPSSQGGGSIFAATQLSSKTFTTNTATVTESLTVTGPSSINGNLTVTGNITSSSGTLNPGLTAGSVVFQGASGLAQDNPNFFYDDTDNVLGIGTASPTAKITVAGSSGTGTGTITSSSGVNVTGTGTAFLTEVEVGDEITVNGQTRIVATVSSNTALTTTTAFNPVISSAAKVLVISSVTNSTPAAPASVSTLSWNHFIDGTVGSRLLMVSVMSSNSTPTVASVTFGGTAMTLSGSNATSDNRHRLSNYYLLDPPAGLSSVVVTMSGNAVIVGQSVLLGNTARPTPITSGAAGGSSGAPDMIGLVFSSVASSDLVIASFVTDGSITATLDTSFNAATQLLNTTTAATTSNPRALSGYAYGTGGFTYVYFLGNANNTHRYSVSKVVVGTETMGVFRIRTPLLSVVDSSNTSQIKVEAGGLANFHSGINVDLTGDGVTPTVALFNGGNVGIGTTAPTNDLSVGGDADFSGSLGVAGGTVDANIGVNIQSTAAYGGSGVVRYGFSSDLTATDLSNVKGGYFAAGSTYGSVGADHNVVTGVAANASFTGAGRVDNVIGVDVSVSNNLTGNMHDSYGVYGQIANLGQVGESIYNGGQVDTARVYYADIVNASNTHAITSASAFQGQIRTLSGAIGTAGYGTVYGLNLSGWSTFGLPVTTSYGIYMDNSIDIGTTKYALWSQSASQSYLQGALGIADTTPDASLEVVNDGSGDSFLVADTNDGDATPFVIQADGDVGIGTASPSTKLEIGSVDLGDGLAGPVITLGRNTNATNTGAGSINFQSKAGVAGYVWQDTAGNLRIHSVAPTHAGDAFGTVVGDQTSTRESKQDFADYTTYQDALQMVLAAPLHTFRYKKDVSGYGEDSVLAKTRIGYIADEVPGEFMWGNSIDQVSVNGILMASVKALNNEITSLKVQSYNATSSATILTGHLYLSQDSVGQVKILAGANSVRVNFNTAYEYQPIITITPLDYVDSAYKVSNIDATGFSIELRTSQSVEVNFSWHAFAGQESKLTVSDGSIHNIVLIVPLPPQQDEGQVAGDSIEESVSEPTTQSEDSVELQPTKDAVIPDEPTPDPEIVVEPIPEPSPPTEEPQPSS